MVIEIGYSLIDDPSLLPPPPPPHPNRRTERERKIKAFQITSFINIIILSIT